MLAWKDVNPESELHGSQPNAALSQRGHRDVARVGLARGVPA